VPLLKDENGTTVKRSVATDDPEGDAARYHNYQIKNTRHPGSKKALCLRYMHLTKIKVSVAT
jgi:hypothetical protein